LGLFLAPTIIYQNPEKVLGGMLQIGYDNRKGKFDQVTTPCNCPADLKTNLSYVTIEPSLRVAPFKGKFYVYGGPRLAFNVGKSFVYDKGISADGSIPASPELKGDFSKMNSTVISMHIGAGYDILLSSKVKGTAEEGRIYKQVILSPFVDVHPYFGQNPRSIETWNLTTVRVGAVLKFGHVKTKPVAVREVPIVKRDTTPVVVKPVPVVVPVVVVPEPIKITTAYTLYFKFDKSNLDNQTIDNLDKMVKDLKKDAKIGIEIKSYADVRGTENYNVKLSERRSKAVVDYLISKGIDASRITSQGLGETSGFNKNNDSKINDSNYALNRRSNIVVIDFTNK
jgi:outer membrane protein OmpA-like peptidoglycan-associated protein